MPDWLHQLSSPWTTPFTLGAAVVGLGALIGLRGRKLAVLAAMVAAGLGLWQAWKIGPPSGLLDLKIYVNSARSWWEGNSVYDYRDNVFNLSATYPPIGPLLFTPFIWLTADGREVLVTALSLLALGASAWFTTGLAGIKREDRVTSALWFFALSLVSIPVWLTLRQGQINIFLWFLVLWDLNHLRKNSRFGGIGVGFATAIKLIPGLFLAWFVIAKKWNAAFIAFATFLFATGIGWALAPSDSRLYWTDLLWQSDRVGSIDDARNNSVWAVIARAVDGDGTILWIACVIAILIIAGIRSQRAGKQNDYLAVAAIVGAAASAISPISWTHHLGFLLLALLCCWQVSTTRWQKVLCLIAYVALVGPSSHGDEVIWSTLRAFALIAAVIATPIRSYRSSSATDAEKADGFSRKHNATTTAKRDAENLSH